MKVALLALWGCASDARFEVRPAEADTPLTPTLVAELDRPGSLRVRITDDRGVRELALDEVSETHEVPLLGVRAGDELTLRVEAFDERRTFASDELTVTVGELPADVPIVETLAGDADRAEPGLRLLATTRVGDPYAAWSLALDEAGEVVWALANPSEVSDLRRTASGHLVGIRDQVGVELDPLGHLLTVWGPKLPEGMAPETFVELDAARLHHELYVLPGEEELLGLTVVVRPVPRFPCTYEAPERDCGPAEIKDIRVLRFTRGGELLLDQSIGDLLDTFRIGYLSLDRLGGGAYDWAHANAVVPMPDGGILVSVRHQDVLIALDAQGGLRWMLGDPAGWSEAYEPYLLTPVGEGFAWPYHPHGPAFDEDGVLWMFDNHNEGHTPYTPAPSGEVTSRVVGFRVDEQAHTVTQVGSYATTATGELFSRAFGSGHRLPTTGDLLAGYGMPLEDDLGSNVAQGFGSRAARVVEWTPDGALALDVRLRSDHEDGDGGWRLFRAVLAPSLYADGVETWLERTP